MRFYVLSDLMPRDECGSAHEEKKQDEEEKKRTTSTFPRRPRASADRTELKPAAAYSAPPTYTALPPAIADYTLALPPYRVVAAVVAVVVVDTLVTVVVAVANSPHQMAGAPSGGGSERARYAWDSGRSCDASARRGGGEGGKVRARRFAVSAMRTRAWGLGEAGS